MHHQRTQSALCIALLLLPSVGRLARAQDAPPPDDGVVRQRLEGIQRFLDQRATRAQLWQYGWMGLGYAVTGAFTGIAVSTHDKTARLDFAFAAGGAFLDTTAHALEPIRVHAASRVHALPDVTPEQARAKLSFAESELEAAAEAEANRQSLLKSQILPVGLPILEGLVLWLGFGHAKGAVANTAAAIVISEIRTLTQPTSAREAWKRYRENPDTLISARRDATGPSWSLAVTPFGSFIYGRF